MAEAASVQLAATYVALAAVTVAATAAENSRVFVAFVVAVLVSFACFDGGGGTSSASAVVRQIAIPQCV